MLSYLDKHLTKKERKSVIKYMTQYRNLDAIIKTKQMDLFPSHTVEYEEKPTQSVRNFHSEAETFAINVDEIEQYRRVKQRLDIAFESVKPVQRSIWEDCFIDGGYDVDVQENIRVSKRTYYREKNELIQVVAECLNSGIK